MDTRLPELLRELENNGLSFELQLTDDGDPDGTGIRDSIQLQVYNWFLANNLSLAGNTLLSPKIILDPEDVRWYLLKKSYTRDGFWKLALLPRNFKGPNMTTIQTAASKFPNTISRQKMILICMFSFSWTYHTY